MSAFPDDGLFDKARDAARVEDVAGQHVRLKRGGRYRLGKCPFCLEGEKSKNPPFKVDAAKQKWKCWRCGERGDVIDLEHRLNGGPGETMRDAALRLTGGAARTPEASARRAQARDDAERQAMEDDAWKAELAKRLWREGQPAAGTLVQTYLEARGIYGPVAARALALLRFHPAAWHSGDPEAGVRLPAMIALITTEHGATGGVHVTYLAPGGKRKTQREPAKRMFGPQGHRIADGEDVQSFPGGIWLTRPDALGPLIVGEGIETTLSRAMMRAGELSLPMRAAAAGSLDRLSGFEAVDPKTGVRDVWKVTPDPARPPFVWPEDPEAPWGEVEVATDGDMKPVKVKGLAGRKRNRPVMFERDGRERARVSGALAIAAWRRRLAEGSETRVRATRAPDGMDFNTVWMAAVEAKAGAAVTEAAA